MMDVNLRDRLRAKAVARPTTEPPPVVAEVAARALALIEETGLPVTDVDFYATKLRNQEESEDPRFLLVKNALDTLVSEFSDRGMTPALAAGELGFHASLAARKEMYRR